MPLTSVFGPAIDAELAALASIEARYWDELNKLELSAVPSSVKDHLRQQLRDEAQDGPRASRPSLGPASRRGDDAEDVQSEDDEALTGDLTI